MRLEERRTLIALLIASAVGAVLFLPAVYFLGLWLAPPRPVPAESRVPPRLGDAIWARADGGRATEMRPLTPINFVSHRVCRALAARVDDPKLRGERRAECMKSLPAIQAVDYLSGVRMRDEHMPPDSFRIDIAQFATAAWLTRSWTRTELLDTLAERGDFGFGWRGVEAALLGGLIGTNDRIDSWCAPDVARETRGRILQRMRDNLAIDDAAFERANASELGLAEPPANHQPCAH